MKALIISADNFKDTELLVPYYRLKEEGIEVDIASISSGKIKGKHGYEVEAKRSLKDIDPEDYDILILPGGKAPGIIRKQRDAIDIARHFFEKGKPVAAICHGPQTLISAGLLKGRHATCYRTVADELRQAGAIYEDREVVIDGNLITSRQPSDLPASGYTMLSAIRFLKKRFPAIIIAAIPTGHDRAINIINAEVEEIVCLNVRAGFSFAVADAYRNWYDLTDHEVIEILSKYDLYPLDRKGMYDINSVIDYH